MTGLVSPPLQYLWFPVDGVGLLRGRVILLVYLYCLVSLARDQTGPLENQYDNNISLNNSMAYPE